MTRLRTWWLAIVVILAAPYALIFVAGMAWLYQQGWLWVWMIASAAVTLVCWQLAKRLQQRHLLPSAMRVEPVPHWPPIAHAVWPKIEAIAERVERADLPLDRIEPAWTVLREVLATVARHYHPNARRPELQVPAPHVLKIVELVAADLRTTLSENVPGAHILTLGDLQSMKRAAAWWQRFYLAYRVASFAYSPVAALVRELRRVAGRGLGSISGAELKRWAVGYFVRRSGFYAIRLYSGDLVLDEVAFDGYTSRASQRAARQADRQAAHAGDEPLRIMVLGQVKAGKSSLVNALFGECRTASDVVLQTPRVQPFVLEREGLRRAIIFDTAGYDAESHGDESFGDLLGPIGTADLLLLVCAATSAARGVDRRLLDRVRTHFQERPDRTMPALVVPLTHVDQLRPFAEWDPPYDVSRGAPGKAAKIQRAIEAVAEDLSVDPATVVPVCLKTERLYNIEEALVPAIFQALPQAEQVRYQRCLRGFQGRRRWRQLWRQAVNSGRLLFGRIRRSGK